MMSLAFPLATQGEAPKPFSSASCSEVLLPTSFPVKGQLDNSSDYRLIFREHYFSKRFTQITSDSFVYVDFVNY